MSSEIAPTPSSITEFNSIWRVWLDTVRNQILSILSAVGIDSSNNVTLGGNLRVDTSGSEPFVVSSDGAGMFFGGSANADVRIVANSAVAIALDDTATAGNTRLFVYDVDNATVERVTVGAANSGGAGYKVLRIPN